MMRLDSALSEIGSDVSEITYERLRARQRTGLICCRRSNTLSDGLWRRRRPPPLMSTAGEA